MRKLLLDQVLGWGIASFSGDVLAHLASTQLL